MLRQRLLVAAAGIPLLALLLLAPERTFSATVTVIIAVGAAEFVLAAPGAMSRSTAALAAVGAAVIVAVLRSVPGLQDWTLAALLVSTLLALALLLYLRPIEGDPPEVTSNAPDGLWWLGGVLYLSVLGVHWPLLRALPHGTLWVLVLLAATFATDTGAYVTGKLFGRHRLWPAVSPNKTWEGFAGGMLAGGLTASMLPVALGIAPWWPWLVALGLGVPLAGIAGDFLESALKRRMGVKDMSSLLPGHGGLLDRLDSLLAIGPLLYWIVQWSTP